MYSFSMRQIQAAVKQLDSIKVTCTETFITAEKGNIQCFDSEKESSVNLDL